MLTVLLASAVLTAPAVEPTVFKLNYQVGDKYTYEHHVTMPFMKMDAVGNAVLTVTAVAKGITTLRTAQVNYTERDAGTFTPLAAGNMFLLESGKLTKITKANPSSVLFAFCGLPEKPVSVGDDFSITLKMPDVTLPLKGKFVSLTGVSKNIATLTMNGALSGGGGIEMKITVIFDVKRGIYLSVVTNMNDGFSTTSLKLKELKK